MADLIEVYEQQYGVLTADITSKIGKLCSSTSSSERRPVTAELDRLIEEVKELLEQMGLEVHDMKHSDQPKIKTRIESYKAELQRLEQEFMKAKSKLDHIDGDSNSFRLDVGDSLYNQHVSLHEEQKQRLLDNSERIERTGKKLVAGYQILMETEDIGNQVLRDLSTQRETIQRARNRLRETDAELSRSARIINGMIARSLQHRFILSAISIVFCLAVISTIYFSYSSGQST